MPSDPDTLSAVGAAERTGRNHPDTFCLTYQLLDYFKWSGMAVKNKERNRWKTYELAYHS